MPISSPLPSELGQLSLESLRLSGYLSASPLPTELFNNTNLQNFWISDSQFTGSIPAEIGFATSLTSVYVSSLGLNGTLPSEIWSLTNLRRLEVSNTPFSGSIPTDIMMPSLETLDLSHSSLPSSSLSGTLPSEIALLQNLVSSFCSFVLVCGN